VNRTIKSYFAFFSLVIIIFLLGCTGTLTRASKDRPYPFSEVEASWIQDGQPIVFENEAWNPKDDVDVLTDQEVFLLGEYQGVQFFVEKADVRPYNRLYTKFAENRFRIFTKNKND
jgi:hypothetical protein